MTTYWPLVRVSIDKETKKLIILRTFKSLLTMISLSFIHHLMVERGFMVCKQAVLPHEIEAIFQQRYDIFVEEYGYLPRAEYFNNTESDTYDPFSIFFGVWDTSILAASCRIVLPQSPVGYPTLNTLKTDTSFVITPMTAEISRITISREYRGYKQAKSIFQLMQAELCTYCDKFHIDAWIGAVSPYFLKLLNKAGLSYEPIGPLQTHIGSERLPVILTRQSYMKSHPC